MVYGSYHKWNYRISLRLNYWIERCMAYVWSAIADNLFTHIFHRLKFNQIELTEWMGRGGWLQRRMKWTKSDVLNVNELVWITINGEFRWLLLNAFDYEINQIYVCCMHSVCIGWVVWFLPPHTHTPSTIFCEYNSIFVQRFRLVMCRAYSNTHSFGLTYNAICYNLFSARILIVHTLSIYINIPFS